MTNEEVVSSVFSKYERMFCAEQKGVVGDMLREAVAAATKSGKYALTPRMRELLAIIADGIDRTGVAPSFEEMRIAMGFSSKSGVHRLIALLEERGHIVRLDHKARAIHLVGGGT